MVMQEPSDSPSMRLFGGIEGGATGSRMVIVDDQMRRIGFAEGPGTNQWLIGIPETVQRLLTLVELALKDSNLPSKTPLLCLGLALSGVDTEETRAQLMSALRTAQPNIATSVHVCNDTIGAVLTVTDRPSIVLVAGTGSICKFVRSDLTFERVGGYSYLLGDGGGAYYIAHWLLSKFIEIEEGLVQWDGGDTSKVRKLVFEFFSIDNCLGLLPHFYENFDKSKIANLCERIALAAHEGDSLCQAAFTEAGIQLGRHVRACIKHAIKELPLDTNEILVVCCGNVFRSWSLLKQGFSDTLTDSDAFFRWNGRVKLVWLQVTAAYGAARLAARLGVRSSLPFPENATQLLDYIRIRTH